MTIARKKLLIISILLAAVCLAVFILLKDTGFDLNIKYLFIISLIIFLGIYAFTNAMVKALDEKKGFPADDERTKLLNYKSGYFAYLGSMYMWLFIFLFRSKFPDIEMMLGGGILLSALIGFITKFAVRTKFNE